MNIEVVKSDGTRISAVPETATEIFETSRVWRSSITVSRMQLSADQLVEDQDEIELYDFGTLQFAGLLRQVNKNDPEKLTLDVDSFERFALEAQPTGARVRFEDVDDTTIVENAISRVPQLSLGTIENVGSGVTLEFNYVSPARMIRVVRDVTGADIVYNNDKTVDYVSNVGQDKSNSITVSPSNGLLRDLTVNTNAGQKQANHLRVLGGGSGEAQVVVDVVADSFDSSTDRIKWATVANKDINDSDTLREYGQKVVNEKARDHIDAEGQLGGSVDVEIGDVIRVEYPEKDVNRDLRITRLEKVRDATGLTKNAKFSSLDIASPDKVDKVVQDVDRFNRVEGSQTIGVFDNPTIAPEVEGNLIYVTGQLSNFERGVYYYNGSSYEGTQFPDVDADNVFASDSFVVPVGTDQSGKMVLPVGPDKYDTT